MRPMELLALVAVEMCIALATSLAETATCAREKSGAPIATPSFPDFSVKSVAGPGMKRTDYVNIDCYCFYPDGSCAIRVAVAVEFERRPSNTVHMKTLIDNCEKRSLE
mmetsp:Transcript_21248/g.34187  ORF Transcript_21248/g.34187 Transcript_21248/m.34187 type:complete len:108 (-) Transcript_21248:581-904(-)